MSRAPRFACLFLLVAAVIVGPAVTPAFAIKQFEDQFKAVYVKEGTPLAAAVATAKCNVCHAGKNKKERNGYGNALAERLDKETDKKDVAKIRAALEEVATLPSAVAGKTFGDLIADGKLPSE